MSTRDRSTGARPAGGFTRAAAGYEKDMLVAVLVPLVVMLVAVLLERLETGALPGRAGHRASRPARTVPADAAASAGGERHLHAVPAVDAPVGEPLPRAA